MKKIWLDNLKEAIENSGRQNRIMVWGASSKSDAIVSVLESWGFTIAGYIDKKSDSMSVYRDSPVYGREKLSEAKCFVFVALRAHYESVLDYLNETGYTEFVDFWYPRKKIELDGTVDYEDLYGNRLVTENVCPIYVLLRDGGAVEIRTKALHETLKIFSTEKAFIQIGERVRFGENVILSSTNGNISIDRGCRFDSFIKIRTTCEGGVYFKERCTIQRQCAFGACFGAKIVCGKDCMISYFVFMRAGNGHNMIDLNSMEHLDDNETRDVILGEHVWVGMRAILLNGAEVGSGSTIGANAFVCKRKFPQNCCLAGSPAKVIREKTAWIRAGFGIYKDIEDYQAFIYDQ